ncbi:MAG: MBL fold metallo-hydrolase [Candidatus Njordarchaeales archaeon]
MPEPIIIHFLGTGGTIPLRNRRLPCIVIQYKDKLLILDIGECCQNVLLIKKFHPIKSKIIILISHLHADHTTGLPGFLTSLKLLGRKDPVMIIGPPGVSNFIYHIEQAFQLLETPFKIIVREAHVISDYSLVTIYEEKDIEILGFKTYHTDYISSIGFIISETQPHKTLNIKRLTKEIGESERNLGKLTANKVEKFLVTIRPPRIIIYTGDSRPVKYLSGLIRTPPDLLIHDATFIGETHHDEAVSTGHSTIEEAVKDALLLNARNVALVHLSPRYEQNDVLRALINSLKSIIMKEKNLSLPTIIIPQDDDYVIIR